MAAAQRRKPVTQKHIDFINTPMKGQPVTNIPGIGSISGKRFKKLGYDEATELYGQYLKDQSGFSNWLTKTVGMTSKDAKSCCRAFEEWSSNYL